jgi:hypothetical protein
MDYNHFVQVIHDSSFCLVGEQSADLFFDLSQHLYTFPLSHCHHQLHCYYVQVIHEKGAQSKHARPNYSGADGKHGRDGNRGSRGQGPGDDGGDGEDGEEGEDGANGQDAVDFNVMIEYKGHDLMTNTRAYSVTTVAGGGKSTQVIPNCILNPCFNSDPYR